MIQPKTPGPNATAVAYIRRSVARRNDPGDVSREFQTEKVRALAGADGTALRIVDGDWGVSAGREHRSARTAFRDLLVDIEAGRVSLLIAYSADRLARDTELSMRLLNVCEDAGVTIVTSEGRYAPGDDNARNLFGFQALMNENALRGMQRKARSTVETRRGNGAHLGNAPYGTRVVGGKLVERPEENIGTVVDAYRRAGSLQATARLLNAEKVPTRNGRPWWASSVRSILEAQAPDILPPKVGGRRQAAAYRLSGLLRCAHDDSILVGKPARKKAAYRCRLAIERPGHPHPTQVPEVAVMPWIKRQVARFRMPEDVRTATTATEARRAELEANRERVIDMYADQTIKTKADRDRRLEAIDRELERTSAAVTVIAMPAIDWAWPAADLNLILRRFFVAIDLGPDMRPVGFESRIPPEWWR